MFNILFKKVTCYQLPFIGYQYPVSVDQYLDTGIWLRASGYKFCVIVIWWLVTRDWYRVYGAFLRCMNPTLNGWIGVCTEPGRRARLQQQSHQSVLRVPGPLQEPRETTPHCQAYNH
mgnify:CR=1 FL=1